jgi:hypothetical protein
MDIRYILWKWGIFCGNLVYFPSFGMLYQEKSGNLAAEDRQSRTCHFLRIKRIGFLYWRGLARLGSAGFCPPGCLANRWFRVLCRGSTSLSCIKKVDWMEAYVLARVWKT